MKRKFVNAILFGALIAASTSVVQSCKDYDDDIDNLQTEITTSAEDLTSLIDEKVANVQKEITSLESQIPALEEAYKAADAALNTAIENATNDAKGYADIQAAEAQTAAIAAAQNAVEQAKSELQASLDAANKIIDEQGKTVSSLLEADKTLTSGIEAAQAQADKAYALAEQASQTAAENKAEIEKLSTELGKINETLDSQISIFGEQISDVLATANQNKADIEAQEAALAQVKADNEKALQALSNEDAELKKLIEENQTSIETTKKELEDLKKSIEEDLAEAKLYAESLVNGAKKELQDQIDNVNIDITTLETQYSNLESEIEDLKAALEDLIGSDTGDGGDTGENPGTIEDLKERIENNEKAIEKINNEITLINSYLDVLSQNLANLITSIIVQDCELDCRYGEKLGSKVEFPYADFQGKLTFDKDKIITDEEAGAIYTTINPNTVNFENTQLQLENSVGEVSANFALDKAVKEDNHLITRSSNNGLYKLPVRYTQFNASGISKEPSVSNALFALVAEYKTKKQVLNPETQTEEFQEVTNKVYSKYEIEEAFESAKYLQYMHVKVVKSDGKEETNDYYNAIKAGGLNATIKYVADIENNYDHNRDIYKKYVECIDVDNNQTPGLKAEEKKAAIAMMNNKLKEIYSRNDENFNGVNIAVDEAYSGYTFKFMYYALGYNGDITTEIFSVNFAKTSDTWTEMTFASTPSNAGTQTVNEKATDFADAPFFAPDVIDEWERKVTKVRVRNTSTYGNNNATVEAVKYVNLYASKDKDGNPTGSPIITIAAGNTNTYRSGAKVMQIGYDPQAQGLEVGKSHSFVIEYLDANDNVVSTVDCKLTMNIPTKYAVSPIPAMFDGDLTIGWASYNNGKAEYDLSNSFNNVAGWSDAAYWFIDATKYDNNTSVLKLDGVSLAGNKILVSTSAVDKENWTYSLEAGIMYYGVANLWTNEKSFTLKLQSPIRHASFAFQKKNGGNWVETQAYDVKNGGSLELTDDNIKSLNYKNDPIKYLGTSGSIDNLIKDVKVELADANDPNKGLIESQNVASGKLLIVTKTNGAMVSDAAIKFNLVVTDKFGLVTKHQFTLNVLK